MITIVKGDIVERNDPGRRISTWLGEFRDEKLEKEFRQSGFYKVRALVRPLLIFLSSLFSIVILFDLLFGKEQYYPIISIPLRILYIIASILVIIKVSSVQDFYSLSMMLTAYEFLSICVFFYLIGVTINTYSYMSIGAGIITISILVFMIPNRWVHSVFLSVITILCYFALFHPVGLEAELLNRMVGTIFILSSISLIAVLAIRSAIDQRVQYLSNLKLLQLSLTDPLTGIANRGRFNDSMQSWIKCANEYNVPISLVLFDFDNFKKVNDTYGHLIGDQVILQTVNLVDEAIRHRDLFARWGGEEFTCLFPDTQLDEAMEIVERLRQTISSNHYIKCGHVTASFGLAQYRKGESADAFMDRADRLLYNAKNDGKNCIRAAG